MTTPNTAAAVAENVRAQMGRQRVTAVALAKASGINRVTLSRRLNGEVAFSVDELQAVADSLSTTLAALIAVERASA